MPMCKVSKIQGGLSLVVHCEVCKKSAASSITDAQRGDAIRGAFAVKDAFNDIVSKLALLGCFHSTPNTHNKLLNDVQDFK